MPYFDHFKLADDLIGHLTPQLSGNENAFLASRYTGFVSVAGVTVYELAIKSIFFEFGEKKHKVFGAFTKNSFDRINGRIKYKELCDDYVSRFGDKYVKKFKHKVKAKEDTVLRENRRSMLESYRNLIVWRNQFAHEGTLPTLATFNEAVASYELGKEMINCLGEAMQR